MGLNLPAEEKGLDGESLCGRRKDFLFKEVMKDGQGEESQGY
jgi:hypothetical protein